MSTNRTKIDWAYKQAQRIFVIARNPLPANLDTPQARAAVREIAARLRRMEAKR